MALEILHVLSFITSNLIVKIQDFGPCFLLNHFAKSAIIVIFAGHFCLG